MCGIGHIGTNGPHIGPAYTIRGIMITAKTKECHSGFLPMQSKCTALHDRNITCDRNICQCQRRGPVL